MQKLMLDNHIKDLVRQVNRHKDYVAEGEQAEMLVDRAIQLKLNVQKGDQIEQSLITNFSNLTLLLELLNMEGDETQNAEGIKMSNKVTVEIEKYTGRIETLQHKHRATLLFALTKRPETSSDSSQNSSRNNSRIHAHLKPKDICWDDSLEIVLKFQEQFRICIKEFVWNSLIALLHHEWTKILNEDESLKNKDLDQIFQRINIILLDRFPLVVRRMDY